MKNILTMGALMAAAAATAAPTDNRFLGMDGQGLYVGQGDDLLNFAGDVQNFAQEGDVSRQFAITLTNGGAGTLTAQLFAGYLTGRTGLRPGQITEGAFNDIAGGIGLSASSATPGVTVDEIVAYLNEFPTRIILLRVKSTNSAQLDQNITVKELSIYGGKTDEFVRPSLGISETNLNDKISTIRTDIQIGRLSDIRYPVVAGASVTLTFFCGAEVNTESYLRKRAKKGKAAAAIVGTQQIVAQAEARKALGA